MRQLERLATYWLIRMILADVIALALLAAAATAAVKLWRECMVLVGW